MLKQRIKEVIKNFDNLKKARSDNGMFVIIAEKDNRGGYDEYKECLGVKKDGTLIWSFLSGCSCRGDNEEREVRDITVKIFKIEENNTTESFYEKNKIEPYEASYGSY